MVNVAAAQVSAGLQHEIGDLAANEGGLFNEGAPIHTVLHGLVGCAAGQVTSGSCAGGAAAGAAQSLYAGFTDALNDGQEGGGLTKEQVELQTEIAGIIGGISAVLATGNVDNLQLGQDIAQSGFTNNFLKHAEAFRLEVLKQQLKDCEAADCATIAAEITALEELDIERKNKLETCGTASVKICTDEIFQSFAAGSDWVNTDLRNNNIEQYASDLNPEVLANILNNILPQHFDDLISQQTDAVISYNGYTIDDILNSTDNNRISLSFGSNVDQTKISKHSLNVLKDNAKVNGISSFKITSASRSTVEQARIMYENLVRQGQETQLSLYNNAGDAVVNAGQASIDAGDSASQTQSIMLNEINSQKDANPAAFKHTTDPSVLQAIDIAPTSIPGDVKTGKGQEAEFVNSLAQDPRVSNILHPGNNTDRAIHVEIPQPKNVLVPKVKP